jgi:hypothetical protein
MRSKLLIGGLGAAVAFLLATSPVVAQAAGFITSGDIVNNTIKSKDVKDHNLQGKDVKADSLTGAEVNEGTLGAVPSATNATNLAGKAASSYTDNATVYTFNKTVASTSTTVTIPLAAGGTYEVSYSLYMEGAADGGDADALNTSTCYLRRFNSGGSLQYTADESSSTSATGPPAHSAIGVVPVAAGETVVLFCQGETAWTSYTGVAGAEPIQILVHRLDSVTNATVTGTRASGGRS